MKWFTAGGCPARRELFAHDDAQRVCDGQELNIQTVIIGWNALQAPMRVIQTYIREDIV